MTCRKLPPLNEDAIVEVARGREAGRGTVAAVEAHVEHCAACAARLARERQLSEGLRALAAATASAAPSEAMERQLRAAFEAQHVPASRAWWKGAAAAAALVAAAGWWWMSRDAQPGPDAGVRAANPPVVVPAPPTGAPPADVAPSVGTAPQPEANRAARGGRPGRPGPAQAADFVALPAAAGLPPFESGVIVRMELPVAALPAYGFEIVPGRKAPIEADLLIGQDGQARAIRLVSRSIARSGAEQ